jgi:hypothetical protein
VVGNAQHWFDDAFSAAQKSETKTSGCAVDTYSGKSLKTVLVMNESKLSTEERARLWHNRLGHCGPQKLVNMSKQGLVTGMDVRHLLNEDCDCCDKRLFKKGLFPRNTLET